jgi:periplasmic divalent cation tolerance protein
MATEMDVLIVLCMAPDLAVADRLAATLVESGKAACVNILAPCRSVYRWHGEIESANEVPLLIKTTSGRYSELEAAIRFEHPYEVPEIVAIPLVAGLPAYLGWVRAETAGGGCDA